MDLKLFFIGIGFLTRAHLTYRYVKNEKPSSEKKIGKVLNFLTILVYGAVLL